MNLKEIIGSTRAYNFHSHTQFCDGRAPMGAIVEAAEKAGMRHLGFTPHSPVPIESSCNMKASDVEAYMAEFRRLKEEYAGRVELYLSMEIDFLGDGWGASVPYFQNLPLDYRLSSVHFVPDPDTGEEIDVDGRPEHFVGKMHAHFHDDIRMVVDHFYERTIRMIEMGGFDMVGHFDKIGFNASAFCPGVEETAWYQAHIDRLVDALRESGTVVEINTKAWIPNVGIPAEGYVPRLFPSAPTIAKLVRAGVPIAVNSDVHYPDRITAGRDAAFAVIDAVRP